MPKPLKLRRAVLATIAGLVVLAGLAGPAQATWFTLADPIDPANLTQLPFGLRSHWIQPWRAYLDTVPAPVLRGALGINLNSGPDTFAADAQALAAAGFKHARIEIGWDVMSYDDPSRISWPGPLIDARIAALRAAGIRPLILLNANDGRPGPARDVELQVSAAAPAGARELQLAPADAAQLTPGLSGIDLPGYSLAQVLVTSVSADGRAELSQPLPVALAPGAYRFSLLRYQPFGKPYNADGSPNAAFQATLRGWLAYVSAVTHEVKQVLGSDAFDVEIWNEESFGSNFLFAERYYSPLPAQFAGAGTVEQALTQATVDWLRDPANGVKNVGITDGFASQTPFAAPSNAPGGLTALSKHPYAPTVTFPQDSSFNGVRATDALGSPEGFRDADGAWHDAFTPSYRALFPEYYLTGIQTESLIRDITPLASDIYGTPHGRRASATQTWITEIGTAGVDPMTAADRRHLQAKAALRTLASYVNKGVTQLDFYGADGGDLGMLDRSAAGDGETIQALARLTSAMAGPDTVSNPRSLGLAAIASQDEAAQFAGDGTAAHPPLLNRDVVAFLPFQTDSNRFVIPAYVMTRDLATLYDPAAPSGDVTRYDLPPDEYRFTITGVDAATLAASATDPLTGDSVPVTIVARAGDTAVVEMPLTDSPRLLELTDGGAPATTSCPAAAGARRIAGARDDHRPATRKTARKRAKRAGRAAARAHRRPARRSSRARPATTGKARPRPRARAASAVTKPTAPAAQPAATAGAQPQTPAPPAAAPACGA